MKFLLDFNFYKKNYLNYVILVFATIILICGGYFFYLSELIYTKQKIKSELAILTKLKTSQVEQWIEERKSDCRYIESILKSNYKFQITDVNKIKFNANLQTIINNHKYHNILIVSSDKNLMFSFRSPEHGLYQSLNKLTDNSFIYYNTHFNNILFELHYKLQSTGKNPLFLIIQLTASEFLFPQIQNLPTPSITAETLIFKKQKDSLLYLNSLRHINNNKLTIKIPLHRNEILAIKAIKGNFGFIEGKDYREAEVFAYAGKIKNTDWFILTKIDKSEVFRELYERITYILIIIFIAFFLIILILYSYNFSQKNKLLIRLLHMQQESKIILDSIGDAVIATDNNGIVLVFRDQSQERENEKRLAKANYDMQKIFESIKDGFIALGLNWEFLFINQRASELLFKGNGNILIGKNIWKENPELLNQAFHINCLKAVESGEPIVVEENYTFWNKWFENRIYPSETGISIYFTDITERKRNEFIIKKSEEKYRKLHESMMDGFAFVSMDGKIIECNKVYLEMLGYDAEEIKHKTYIELTPAKWHQYENDIVNNQILINGYSQVYEKEYIRKDGSIFPIELRTFLIKDVIGNPVGMWGIARDITKRKIVSEEKMLLSNLIEASLNEIYLFESSSLKFKYANQEALNNIGYNLEELKSLTPLDIKPDFQKTEFLELLIPLIKNEQKIITFTTRHLRKDKTFYPVEVHLQLIDQLFLAIILDISEKEKTLKALNESEEKFKSYIDSAPNIITIISSSGAIKYINRTEFDMDKEIFLSKNIFDFIMPEYHTVVKTAIIETLNSGNPNSYITSYSNSQTQYWYDNHIAKISKDKNDSDLLIISTNITEKIISDQQLLHKQEIINRMEILSHIGGWEIDLITMNNYWTPETYRIHEIDFNFVPTIENAIAFYTPVSQPIIKKAVDELIQYNTPFNLELEIITAKGNKKYVKAIGEAKRFGNKTLKISGSFQDITEQKINEILLKIQYNISNSLITSKNLTEIFKDIQNELSLIIDTTNIIFALYDKKKEMLYSAFNLDEKDVIPEYWPVNDSLSGYILRENKPLLLYKEDYLELINNKTFVSRGTIPEIIIGVPLSINNSSIGVILIQHYKDRNSYNLRSLEILKIIGNELSVFIERFRNETYNRKFSIAVERSPLSIVITDNNGIIEYSNPKFTELTGFKLDEVIGKNPRLFKSGETPFSVYEDLWKTILNGENWSGELQNRKKNGELYWENMIIAPLKNDNNQITNFIAIKEDITEKRNIVEELIKAKDKAEEMNKIKNYFFANMSHELRTPFVGIMGYAELLYETMQNPEEKMLAEGILETSHRLTDTLTKILELTRIEFNQTEIDCSETDIYEIISLVSHQFIIPAEKKHLIIKKEIEFQSLIINTDKRLIYEIIRNLINNAINYTEEGHILIKSWVEEKLAGSVLFVKIEDSGIGIPESHQEVIWDAFRQVSEGTTRQYQGTGLGLTIVKKYIERLGGKIYLKSEVGKGSSFTFELPINNNIPLTQIVPIVNENKSEMRSPLKKILYVEDDLNSRAIYKMVLSKLYNIEVVDNAENAIKLLEEQHNFDLFLIDINLGAGMNGVEFLHYLRNVEKYTNTPTVALTAYAGEDDKKDFLSNGFNYFLAKPFLKKDLLNLLEEIFKEN